jgi:hypothetical protein
MTGSKSDLGGFLREGSWILQVCDVLGREGGKCVCCAEADGAVVDEGGRVGSFAAEAGAETVFWGDQRGFRLGIGQGSPDGR